MNQNKSSCPVRAQIWGGEKGRAQEGVVVACYITWGNQRLWIRVKGLLQVVDSLWRQQQVEVPLSLHPTGILAEKSSRDNRLEF